jgi:hypothetical protein
MGLPVRCVRDEAADFGGSEGDDDVEETSGYLTASNFTWNPEKKSGATVEDVEGGYVKIEFTEKQQGFWVTNDTQTSSSTVAKIVVEDFQTFSNGEPVEITKGCGFYAVVDGTGTYFMSSTDKAKIFSEGVQFQTSNSGYGSQPMPLTILMKAKLTFE